jgi:hypothetical protein
MSAYGGGGPLVQSGTAVVTKQDDSKTVFFGQAMASAHYTVVPHADGVNTALRCENVTKECFRLWMKPKVDAAVHWVAVDGGES